MTSNDSEGTTVISETLSLRAGGSEVGAGGGSGEGRGGRFDVPDVRITLEAGREDAHGRLEVLRLEDVGNPDLVGSQTRRRVEAPRGGDHDGRAVERKVREHPAREVVAVADGQARDEVEGALRLRQEDAGDLLQAAVEAVATPLVFLDDAAVILRRELRGPDGNELRQARRRQPPLRHPQARPVDVPVARGEAPQADATGAVALRQAVSDDNEVFNAGELERGTRLSPVVEELPVDLVGNEEQTAVAAELRDHLELLVEIDRPRGIVGVAEKDEPRLASHRALPHFARRKMEPFLDPARQRDQAHAGHLGEGGVVRVERLDDESLLPFARAGQHREEDRLAASRRRENFVERKRDPETRVVLPQRREIFG